MTTAGFALASAALAIGLAVMNRMAIQVIQPEPGDPERTVPDLGVEHEDLSIPSGNHRLAAWLLHPGGDHSPDPLVLLAHGWGASYGTVLQLAEPLAERGHDVLLFDVRGHGRNPSQPYVTVRDFRDDVMSVIDYATERFPGRRLVLVGHSFGGAAGVLAVAEGSEVDGLALIASPSDVLDVTAEYLSDHGLPGRVMVWVLRPFWWARIRSSFRAHTPHSRIDELEIPLLLIQPEHDTRVRRYHADRLARSAGMDYVLIADRGHTDVLEAAETVDLVEGLVRRVAEA